MSNEPKHEELSIVERLAARIAYGQRAKEEMPQFEFRTSEGTQLFHVRFCYDGTLSSVDQGMRRSDFLVFAAWFAANALNNTERRELRDRLEEMDAPPPAQVEAKPEPQPTPAPSGLIGVWRNAWPKKPVHPCGHCICGKPLVACVGSSAGYCPECGRCFSIDKPIPCACKTAPESVQ